MGEMVYAAYALLAAFAAALIFGYILVPLLKRLKMGQQIRDDGPKTHLSKAGTPTMGGVIIMLALLVGVFVFARGSLDYIWIAVGLTLLFGIIGLVDDMIIVVRKRSLGLKAYQKLIIQFAVAAAVSLIAYYNTGIGSKLIVPFTSIEWDLGFWYIPFTTIAVVLIVNSVNLTDGLDGLASSVSLVNAVAYAVIFFGLFAAAQKGGSGQVQDGMKNMMLFSAALAGACLGFLRFNTFPAKVFMGDTGAFALGGAFSAIAIISRMQLLLIITGFMFLASSISVVLQVGSYKTRKKRIFKMAPLHHHYELKGVPETKIVTFYTMITFILCIIGIIAVY